MDKKKTNSPATRREQLRYMRVLEQCSGNLSEASEMLGITRQTLYKYKKRMWDEYVSTKQEVFEDSLTIEAKKLDIAKGLDQITGRMTTTFELLMDRIDERIQANSVLYDKKGNKRYEVETRDLVSLANILGPYLAEKRGVLGAKENEANPLSKSTSFVQNIINVMNERKAKGLNETNVEEGEADEVN